MWLSTKSRRTAIRGLVKRTFPPMTSDQGPVSNSSVAEASAALAASTLRSSVSRIATRDSSSVARGGGASFGAASNESPPSAIAAHVGRLARCVASPPIVDDLWCGFHVSRSSATRASTRRVVAISWSNSGRIDALSDMVVPSPRWECGTFGPPRLAVHGSCRISTPATVRFWPHVCDR